MVSNRFRFQLLALGLALPPAVASAQATARPFYELQQILRADVPILVVDTGGTEVRGRVTEVSETSLTLLEAVWEDIRGGTSVRTTGTTRRFESDSVAAVFALDRAGRRATRLYVQGQGSFDAPQALKPGTRVVLIDRTGRKTSGKIAEVSPTSVVLSSAAPASIRTRQQPLMRQETFTASDVAEIRAVDGVGKGLAIGLGVGAPLGCLLAAWRESPSAVFGAAAVGMVIGVAIDASIPGPVIYSSSQATRTVRVAPLVRKDGSGVLVSMRF